MEGSWAEVGVGGGEEPWTVPTMEEFKLQNLGPHLLPKQERETVRQKGIRAREGVGEARRGGGKEGKKKQQQHKGVRN